MNLEIVNPIRCPSWDEMVLAKPGYSFFHSAAWARVLHESYGYVPRYFTVFENGGISALIPVMEVKSFLTGKRGVSLPFSDYCEPVTPSAKDFEEMFSSLVRFGKDAGWKSIEIRGGNDVLRRWHFGSYFYGHTLELSRDEADVMRKFRDSVKRNIKKSLKAGVAVDIYTSREALGEYYRLHCMTRKLHGLPPQPGRFFDMIHTCAIARNKGFVAIASHGGRAIAGAVFFHFGRKAYYKYGASDRRYQHLRANNLVMWEAIRWYCRSGFRSLCFGRTELENEGLMQFKSGWGARERIIYYYTYDVAHGRFVHKGPRVAGMHNRIFSRAPMPILRVAGEVLYRYVG